jgi:hypothetical protein
VTTFSISELTQQASRTGRVVMVLVYPDAVSAQAESSRAEAHEAAATSEGLTPDHGPHLVPGYGWSLWWHNVAMVESTRQELARTYAAELDSDSLSMLGAAKVTAPTPLQVTSAIDFDIVAVIDDGSGNL